MEDAAVLADGGAAAVRVLRLLAAVLADGVAAARPLAAMLTTGYLCLGKSIVFRMQLMLSLLTTGYLCLGKSIVFRMQLMLSWSHSLRCR
jgi:hypothetical protein